MIRRNRDQNAHFKQKPSFEDTTKLLETVLIISALLLSFSISGLQSVDHEDLLQADKRWLRAFHGPAILKDTNLFVPSLWFLYRVYQCLGIFTTVLITSTSIYASLMYSESRGNSEAFQRWSRVFQNLIICEYIALLAGVIILLQVNLSLVDINFPLFYIDELCVGRGTNSTCIANNVTLDLSDAVDCPSKRGASRCLSWVDFAHQSTVQYYMKNIIIIFSVGAGSALVLYGIVLLRSRRNNLCNENSRPESDTSKELSLLRAKYHEEFKRAVLSEHQIHQLSVNHMVNYLNVPLSDAVKMHTLQQQDY
jgi:hypothetical protein